jgi:hypothetical protein
MNVKVGIRRLALVIGLVGLVLGIIPASYEFNELNAQMRKQKEFDSLSTSDAVKDAVRRLLSTPDSPLASEIRSTFPGAYENRSDADLAGAFSAQVRHVANTSSRPTDINELNVAGCVSNPKGTNH